MISVRQVRNKPDVRDTFCAICFIVSINFTAATPRPPYKARAKALIVLSPLPATNDKESFDDWWESVLRNLRNPEKQRKNFTFPTCWKRRSVDAVTQIHKTGKLQNSSFHCRQKVSLAGNRFTIFCVVMFQICKESQKMSKIVVDVVSCVQQCCKVLKESHLLRSTDISTSAICQLGDFYITSSELQFSMMLFFKKFYTSFTSGLLY